MLCISAFYRGKRREQFPPICPCGRNNTIGGIRSLLPRWENWRDAEQGDHFPVGDSLLYIVMQIVITIRMTEMCSTVSPIGASGGMKTTPSRCPRWQTGPKRTKENHR